MMMMQGFFWCHSVICPVWMVMAEYYIFTAMPPPSALQNSIFFSTQ